LLFSEKEWPDMRSTALFMRSAGERRLAPTGDNEGNSPGGMGNSSLFYHLTLFRHHDLMPKTFHHIPSGPFIILLQKKLRKLNNSVLF
jgi:hypothetical protein